MASYSRQIIVTEVVGSADLTKYDWNIADFGENLISLYPIVGLENVFKGILNHEDDVIMNLNLHYSDEKRFESLWIELDGVETTEVDCADNEIEMFNLLLAEIFRE